jgi:hypothetical protein
VDLVEQPRVVELADQVSPPPITHTLRSPAAAAISACTGATSPRQNRMSAPGTTGRSRWVKTQVGRSSYICCHFSGASSSRSWSSTHSYVVAPIAIAPTAPMKASHVPSRASGSPSTSKSQERELSASAMNPSTLVAV